MACYRVEVEGFVPAQFEAESAEAAWDAYKRRYGDPVRRISHDKIPVVTLLEEDPESPDAT